MSEHKTLPFDLATRDLQADAATLAARLEAFRDRFPTSSQTPIDHESEQPPWPDDSPLPEVTADEFDVQKLRSAMAASGSLIVRGFLDQTTADAYKTIVDHVLSACDVRPKNCSSHDISRSLYCNPPNAITSLMPDAKLSRSRGFHRLSGSAMCIESSSVAEQLLELYEDKGLKSIIGDYLGEEACLSALKWVLRRSKFPINPFSWHQDGAFMGSDINSINMWIPLDTCGGDSDAPGLDVLPVRLREIVNTGTEGAAFTWSVSEGDIGQQYGEQSIISPVFNAGDAFFFDHFYLHRTQFRESFSALRYAIETWFFGNSNFPKNQIPLGW